MKNSVREHRTDKDFGPLFSGELLRDEAIAKVSDNNEKWMEQCIAWVDCLSPSDPFTGEDLRMYLTRIAGYPTHSNAWGALVATLIRSKIIKPTGEWRAMKDQNSHARKTPIYTK